MVTPSQSAASAYALSIVAPLDLILVLSMKSLTPVYVKVVASSGALAGTNSALAVTVRCSFTCPGISFS